MYITISIASIYMYFIYTLAFYIFYRSKYFIYTLAFYIFYRSLYVVCNREASNLIFLDPKSSNYKSLANGKTRSIRMCDIVSVNQ